MCLHAVPKRQNKRRKREVGWGEPRLCPIPPRTFSPTLAIGGWKTVMSKGDHHLACLAREVEALFEGKQAKECTDSSTKSIMKSLFAANTSDAPKRSC